MNNEWSIKTKQIGVIRVSYKLINQLLKFKQNNINTLESGGVLIGKYLNSGGTLLIDDFTPPQVSDQQGRCMYYRSKSHNNLVQQIWRESDHYSTYVGLWHTHPESVPIYSSIDKDDWLYALNNSQYEGKNLLFFIVGQSHIRCWLGTKKIIKNKIELIGELNYGKQ